MKLRRHISHQNINIATAIIGSNCTKMTKIDEIQNNNSNNSFNSSNLNVESDDTFIFNDETDELYQQSVTLTARMWPPVEVGPPSTIWGLPVIIWGIIIGCLIIALLILIALFFCYWILPRRSKFLSPTRLCTTTDSAVKQLESTMAHRKSSITAKNSWGGDSTTPSGHIIVPITVGLIPHHHHHHHHQHQHHTQQYNTSPNPSSIPQQSSSLSSGSHQSNLNNHHHNHQYSLEYSTSPAYCRGGNSSISPGESKYSIPETHKSMWVLNPIRNSNTVLSEHDVSFKSRSLPSWGKSKQRPISTTDDLEELYAKVNFSKKRRNRMRNDEAAIIALCRSRSQNLTGLPLEREGVVIYDERTAL